MKSSACLRRSVRTLIAFLTFLICLAGGVASASAHAELIESDPPVDGLVLSSPEQLTLTFSEIVATSDPVPTVRVLDDQGREQGSSVNPPEGRQLIVNLEPLSPGVYTVEWSVRSDTDGHQLSGTYAFRIGGGLPAGAATTSGESPQIWAVMARWLTFLGVALASAGFLFGFVDRQTTVPKRRLIAIFVGAFTAFLATISEPLFQMVFPPEGNSITLASSLRSLPDPWWIRPPTLLMAISLAIWLLLRRGLPASRWLQIVGGVTSLTALLGLSLTSHAAGRDSWRELAVAIDIAHQWSVALWVGGLVHLIIIWPWANQDAQTHSMKRFSQYALILFLIGTATGLANAGFVFPALDTLWNSNYGYVLIVKVAILIVPFGLAIYHRRVINAARQIPTLFRTTLRIEVIAAAAVLLGGAALALSAPPIAEVSGPDNVTLFQFERNSQGETIGLIHLRIAPLEPGDNEITVWLTDLQGTRLSAPEPPVVSLGFSSLDHGTASVPTDLQPTSTNPQDYVASGLDLSLDGWWQIDASITRGTERSTASFYVLLPDPNMHGTSAAPTSADDPEARAVYERAITTMQSQTALDWTESINTGADTMILMEFSQIAESATVPVSVEQVLAYSASFSLRSNGSMPPSPTFNSYHSVSIGDESWLLQENGTWLAQPKSRYGTIAEWGSIYENAEYLRLGDVVPIDGRLTQIISFHTPNQPGQSEAWFTWWVDVGTGEVQRVAMVASSHYMVWTYLGFGDEVDITQPPNEPANDATPIASPIG